MAALAGFLRRRADAEVRAIQVRALRIPFWPPTKKLKTSSVSVKPGTDHQPAKPKSEKPLSEIEAWMSADLYEDIEEHHPMPQRHNIDAYKAFIQVAVNPIATLCQVTSYTLCNITRVLSMASRWRIATGCRSLSSVWAVGQ